MPRRTFDIDRSSFDTIVAEIVAVHGDPRINAVTDWAHPGGDYGDYRRASAVWFLDHHNHGLHVDYYVRLVQIESWNHESTDGQLARWSATVGGALAPVEWVRAAARAAQLLPE